MKTRKYLLLALVTLIAAASCIKHSTVDLSNESERMDPMLKQIKDFPQNYNKPATENLNFLSSDENMNKCNIRPKATESDFYYFLPLLKAKLTSEGEGTQFENGCFKKNIFKIEKISKAETILIIEASDPKSFFCQDSYIISLSNFHKIQTNYFHGEHKITLKNLTDNDILDLHVNGVRLFAFCQGFFTSAHSLLMTLELYLGGFGKNPDSKVPILRPKVPEYMEKENVEFLSRYVNNKLNKREQYGEAILDFDISEIKTGDFVAIYRLDGLDPLIMLGTGSHIGHSAVACWINGELNVLESQDGWYWPKHGIQRNKWATWVEWAHNADFNVAILPLKEEYRKKLDVEKAVKWFESIEGTPYGYRNFLFSWIDTPYKNLPSLLDSETVILVFTILEKISKKTVDTILGVAFNMRVGTKGKSMHEVAYEAAKKNITIEGVLAIVEKEGWVYSDGLNYVCSCFVIAFYKHGDMFGDLDIEPNEFTPKDVYQLNIYDRTYKDRRPKICKDADPQLEYCQVIGKYQVTLPGYASIEPYAHMNENCPSIGPEYLRPEGC